MKITLVAAIASNNAIGKNNQLLWHLPDDFKFFKKYTTGKTIVMGRKTYESIGKPLPNRTNVVISSSVLDRAEKNGVLFFSSLESCLDYFKHEEEVCIIGGGKIYELALPLANRLVLTRVNTMVDGDVFFPSVNFNQYDRILSEFHPADEKHLYSFTFEIWDKKTQGPA